MFDYNRAYYVITKDDEIENNIQFHDGLVESNRGIHFYNNIWLMKNLWKYTDSHEWVRVLIVPKNTKIDHVIEGESFVSKIVYMYQRVDIDYFTSMFKPEIVYDVKEIQINGKFYQI